MNEEELKLKQDALALIGAIVKAMMVMNHRISPDDIRKTLQDKAQRADDEQTQRLCLVALKMLNGALH